MQTDSTEEDEPTSTSDGGLTQAWDTVGAGATKGNPRQRELNQGERKCSAMRLRVRSVGHRAPAIRTFKSHIIKMRGC